MFDSLTGVVNRLNGNFFLNFIVILSCKLDYRLKIIGLSSIIVVRANLLV